MVSTERLEELWSELSPKQQFAAIEQLLAGAQYETADRLLARSQYAHKGDRMIQRFYVGMVRKGQGRHVESVGIFRELLNSHPEFARVRLELAQTLYAINEDASAGHHFELLLGGAGATNNLTDAARGYINAIDSRRRWDFTTFATIAPSTNLNQGADSRVVNLNGLPFQLSSKNVKQSGVGFIGGASAGYRQPLTDRLDVVISGTVLTKRYQENDFNETLATVSVGPRYRFDWGFVGLYALGEAHWVADEDQNTSLGGMFSLGLNLSPADLFFTDVSCSNRYFNDDWQNTNLTYQDGHICSVTARLDHHLSSQSFMRVLGGAGQERTGRDYLDNDFWSAGAGIYQEWGWGISLYLQGLYTRKDFDGISPGITEGRRDNRIDASVNLTKRDLVLLGMAPMMQYTYTHNISNVPFYQFDAHSMNLTLTKKF
jgi:outer membrane protein